VLRVLVAEDHPVNRAYMEAVLDKLGHRALFCDNGESCVRAVEAGTFDVILMDLHMPVMDGFAAARAIRAMPAPRGQLPIIALTADAFQDSRNLAREVGMDDFLTKPAHLPQLRDALQRYGAAGAQRAGTTLVAAEPDGGPPQLDRATIDDIRRLLSPARYAALLGLFFADAPAMLASLRLHAERDRNDALRAEAHALKGAAASLGLHAVGEVAETLRGLAPDTPRAVVDAAIAGLEQHIASARSACLGLGLIGEPAAQRAH